MNTVAISNQKGGVGKSTLTVLLAHWLADKHGQRVAVLDLDSQCNTSKTLAKYACGNETTPLFEPAPIAITTDASERLVLFPAARHWPIWNGANRTACFRPFGSMSARLRGTSMRS